MIYSNDIFHILDELFVGISFGFVCCDRDRYLSIVICFVAAAVFMEFRLAEDSGRFVYLFHWSRVFHRRNANTFISINNVCLTQDAQTS